MNKYLITLLFVPTLACSDVLDEDAGGNRYEGPELKEVELLNVKENQAYDAENPLEITVRNNSDVYLDRVAIECNVTDERGFRAYKDLVFHSAASFNWHIDFPPVTTPEIGIPPGAVAKIGVYTTEERWTHRHGMYSFDCRIYDADGRK